MGAGDAFGFSQHLGDLNPAPQGLSSCSKPGGHVFRHKYHTGKLLGKGSQGRVFTCSHRETRREYAVKVIDCQSSKFSLQAYEREVELCRACCESCNIVQVMEDFHENNFCYIIFEKFEGHLRKGLKWVSKNCGEVKILDGVGNVALRRILHQALSGIAHLHRTGIVHRDIKAHNLLVDRVDIRDIRCRVVVTDLGLARRLEVGRFLSAQVGTRKYWAPELYNKKYWHNVDVFAIGVVLFLAATSTYPFNDEEQSCHRDVFAEGLVPECLIAEAKDFMQKCLDKAPVSRPTADQMLAHPWFCGTYNFPVGTSIFGSSGIQTPCSTPHWNDVSFGPKLGPTRSAAPRPPDSPVMHTDYEEATKKLLSCSPANTADDSTTALDELREDIAGQTIMSVHSPHKPIFLGTSPSVTPKPLLEPISLPPSEASQSPSRGRELQQTQTADGTNSDGSSMFDSKAVLADDSIFIPEQLPSEESPPILLMSGDGRPRLLSPCNNFGTFVDKGSMLRLPPALPASPRPFMAVSVGAPLPHDMASTPNIKSCQPPDDMDEFSMSSTPPQPHECTQPFRVNSSPWPAFRPSMTRLPAPKSSMDDMQPAVLVERLPSDDRRTPLEYVTSFEGSGGNKLSDEALRNRNFGGTVCIAPATFAGTFKNDAPLVQTQLPASPPCRESYL